MSTSSEGWSGNYDDWDTFLNEWPADRVRAMTLDEYTKAGSKETFTHWIESKLSKYGSIWGGSSFKFGVYSRADATPKESDGTRSYSHDHGWYTNDGDSPEAAFEVTKAKIVSVVEAIRSGNAVAIDEIDLGPAYKWKIAFHYQDRAQPLVVAIFMHTALATLCDERPNSRKISSYHSRLMTERSENEDLLSFSRGLWNHWLEISKQDDPAAETGELPLNTVFYGPPGTGKTYTTVSRALKIICQSDDTLSDAIADQLDDPQADREAIEEHFFRLIDEQRIAFLSFHPSYTYEDLVHGIRPVLAETNTVAYELKDGPFKRISEAARSEYAKRSGPFEISDETRVFKMSLGNANKADDREIYDYCIDNGLIAHGFGLGIDFAPMLEGCDKSEGETRIRTRLAEEGHDAGVFATRVIWWFLKELRIGDLVVVSKGNYKIRAIGRITGEYMHLDTGDIRYDQTRSVEWLVEGADIPVEQVSTKVFSQQTLYEMNRYDMRWDNFRTLLARPAGNDTPRNYVVIIDEINRGNIPRIFGELITLLEPDKRLRPGPDGRLMGYRVTLPGAQDGDPPFGVPANLYVIATMNTADKSVTTLDIALRRRFTFEPMYIRYDLVPDDDLRELLKSLNERIRTEKDRDHQIGHSYFMHASFSDLQPLLNNKIIPLLEDYFFGDETKVKGLFSGLSLGGGRVEESSTGALRFDEGR